MFQTHYYKALIESEKDSEFAGIYADTRSGKTSRLRKQFTAMLKAARRGEIDYIITKTIFTTDAPKRSRSNSTCCFKSATT